MAILPRQAIETLYCLERDDNSQYSLSDRFIEILCFDGMISPLNIVGVMRLRCSTLHQHAACFYFVQYDNAFFKFV